ncbi:DUF4386 domain-containing protein [Pseudoduganella ginsengisoli]|uniref:DUF4386 family protein n=1 Tax=Pseudoduganella ginsengisoli TaxID=1462440 RepID=A0A6L6PYI6_9BURK|nr:DUF4386 domain-containing protein [Pseudoduganella ginsengisoli]MTW02224.1 DUF4386 family protein [Pseudoduganella ginsengisoli]
MAVTPAFLAVERPQAWHLRLAGLLYLALIVLGAFGEMKVRGSLVVSGDAAATAHNIMASEGLWRAGIAGDLLMHVLDLPVIVVLYLLLRPVDRGVAQFATLINVVQTAVLAANKLNLLLPLFLLGDAAYLKAFPPDQLQTLAYLAVKVHGFGFGIGLIFFGVACVARGWLLFRSGFVPKAIGILMALAGASYLVNSFALLVAPAVADMLFPFIMLPPLVGESVFALWLLAARHRV